VGLDVGWAVRWLTLSAQAMAEHRVELIELDRPIGDSDHGENMDRGFKAVMDKLAEAPPETPGAALKLTAMTLMSKVGGAAGPLYGTAFLRAATALGDTSDVDAATLAAALQAARDGIVVRGKAEPGDKTMVDAWTPAIEAAAAAAAAGDGDVRKVLLAAAEAAEAGAVSTDPMLARKGRASYLGERSIGHRDPGAVSSALILRAAAGATG
jgi:dihydroxyacetone kinase-like protein